MNCAAQAPFPSYRLPDFIRVEIGAGVGFSMPVPIISHVTGAVTTQLYRVAGDSMRPTFEPGECLLVSRRAYRRATPARGDLVIVRDPRDLARRYLKRVVGLPGDEVRLSEGMLYINGGHLPEAYLGGLPAYLGLDENVWKLGDNEYFVMGDDRARSTDSRHFGPVKREMVVGKAWFRVWPLNRIGGV
jgi:signal peptidase I